MLLIAVLASLLGQAGTANAAAAPQPTRTPTPTSAGKPTAKTTPKTAATKVDTQAEHTTAVREIAQNDLSDTCSGAIQTDTVYSCSALAPGTTNFTLTAPQATDMLAIQVVSTNGDGLYPQLTAPDGTGVSCRQPYGSDAETLCPTGQAGSYTLQLSNTAGFTLAYTAVLSDTSCTTVGDADRTLAAPTDYSGTLAAGAAGNCYVLGMASGDVLRSYVSSWQVTETVFDATGAQVCSTGTSGSTSIDCTLTGTAPYRVLASEVYGAAASYDLTMARLSTPEGCPTVDPQAYGTVPDLSSSARCRILHVSVDGPYEFAPVTTGAAVSGSLYNPDGTPVCTPILTAPCTLAAGDYTWALDAADTGVGAFGISFYATNQSQGCTAAGDTDFSSGPATGSFSGAGQQLCLTVPTATGNGIYVFNQPAAGGVSPGVTVYDATGAPQQCQAGSAVYQVCTLTGTAPFNLILSGPATGSYQLIVQRTGDGTGCTAWPQSAFGSGSWGAQVALTSSKQVACLSIPANQHSTGEMVDYSNLTNGVNAAVQVYDATGKRVCSTLGSSTATCAFTSGTAYTAMLAGTGSADTYDLVRRDISSTASCAAPASTTVGGPSTSYTLGSDMDARCLRVTAAVGDKLWFSARTASASSAGAVLEVADPTGTLLCRQWGVACRVTGSTSYVVFTMASGYSGAPVTDHVDTWRVGTANGWVPECTVNSLSVDGFALRSGVFTETSTGYCAVISVKPSQDFGAYGTDSSTTVQTPQVGMFSGAHWSSSENFWHLQCNNINSGDFDFNCLTDSDAEAQQAVLVVSPGQAATPVEYTMQGVCQQGCSSQPVPATLTSVAPAAGPAGTWNQVVLHGTGLNLGTQVDLAQNGVSASGSKPVSVGPDGTSLTVLLNTTGLTPGSYDLVLDGVGYTTGTPSQGYLPGAYTVTAAQSLGHSRLVPITPTRFLDTRIGLGAAKARVGAKGVVSLQVTGVHGVPSTGVTAVVMNVTAVAPTTSGFITVYPYGSQLPLVSNLNFTAGQTVPNLVVVPVGSDGKVNLFNSAGTVDLLADVSGYYTSGSSGSALTAITPTRFLDTRIGLGAPKARVGAKGVVSLQVTGVHGVPSTGVTAVVMNVTAVNPSASGFVTVYPYGSSVPGVSNLNFTAAETIPNLVVVPVSSSGKVDLRNSAGTVDLLADVTGYFSASGSLLSPVTPVRFLDTRIGFGARVGTVGQNGLVSMQVAGVDGVPSTGVSAVVLNVTVTAPTSPSFLAVYPHGQLASNVSNLNFGTGETISNLVVVPVIDGRITFYNHSGSTHLIADLNGYYS